jgi:hypothetical protein
MQGRGSHGRLGPNHARDKAVERIPVVQELVAHAQERELREGAPSGRCADGTLVHAVKRVLVVPACTSMRCATARLARRPAA